MNNRGQIENYSGHSSNDYRQPRNQNSWHRSYRRDNRFGPYTYSDPNRQQRIYTPHKPDPIAISKYLSFILRHPREDSRLQMNEEGYIYIEDILQTGRFRGRMDLPDILNIVETNDKQRFAIKQDVWGKFMIRATQGHSVEVNLRLEEILVPRHFPVVVHGTTYEAWQSIRTEGLKRMNRAYIHFAKGIPGDSGVISGMRNSSEICIFINLEKAMDYGIKFFLSENMVILSKGDKNGIIHPMFFQDVIDRKKLR